MRRISQLCCVIVLIGCLWSNRAVAESDALEQLRLSEQESWLDYIERFAEFDPDTTFDVTFYYISVDIAVDSAYIVGDVRCRFAVTADNTEAIRLYLQNSLIVDSVGGNTSGFSRVEDTVLMHLDQVYGAGDTAEVRLYYQGTPPSYGVKGLRYASHGASEPVIVSLSTPFLAHYWWPCKDGPGDKPDSVYIDITIPDTTINGLPLRATSNGLLDAIVTSGGKITFKWRERYPIVTYYVMVAVSNYVVEEEPYAGPGGEFPLQYHFFNENLTADQAGVARMPEVVDFFSTIFGPYPFAEEKYGITEIGFYGGIENQTNTIQGRAEETWFLVSVHEFAHMWFGDMITCLNWHHGWLNEGFATYSEALWLEHDLGEEAYRVTMENTEYFGGGSVYLEDTSDPSQIFLTIIYNKGAWILHMLRRILGDSVFFDCLIQYATDPEFMYDHATTADFQAVCETVSGVDLNWFFQQWVYGQYYPIYLFSRHTRMNPDQSGPDYQTYIHIEQTQSTDPNVFAMPLEFQLWHGSESAVMEIYNDSREQNAVLETTFSPDSILYDPFNSVLDKHSITAYGIHIISDSLADGITGQPYLDTVLVISESDTFSVEVISGAMPDGWVLDEATGVISGTTVSGLGDFAFTIGAVDALVPSYTDTAAFVVHVDCSEFDPGDADNDCIVNVADAVYIINYIFKGGPPPPQPNLADANADCQINVADAVYLIRYVFQGGDPPQMGCVN